MVEQHVNANCEDTENNYKKYQQLGNTYNTEPGGGPFSTKNCMYIIITITY